MPSTFSRNLGLELIATGEQPAVWGTTNNENFTMIDDAINGVAKITLTSASYSIAVVDGAPEGDGRKKVLYFDGALSDTCNVTFSPNDAQTHYIVINATSGGHAIRFQQGSGTVYELANGFANIIACDGSGAAAGVTAALNNLQVTNLRVDGSIKTPAGLAIEGDVLVSGHVSTGLNLTVGANLIVTGTSTLNGQVGTGHLNTYGNLAITGTLRFDSAGAVAPYDMYYRAAAGQLDRVPIGTEGQFMRVVGGLPGWQTVSFSIGPGTPFVGGVENGVLVANSGILRQSIDFIYDMATGNLGVGEGGASATDKLRLSRTSGGTASIQLNGTSVSHQRVIRVTTNNLSRFSFGVYNDATFSLARHNDSGTIVGVGLNYNRADGHFLFGDGAMDFGALVSFQNDASPCVLRIRGSVPAPGLGAHMTRWERPNGDCWAMVREDGVIHAASYVVLVGPAREGDDVDSIPLEEHFINQIRDDVALRHRLQEALALL